jgi:Zn finger protein HypA/HybF involved in hydrogenase expression
MKAYRTVSGATQYKPALEDVEAAIHGDEMTGFCLACGDSQGGVEPDARKYNCESCGEPKVYGAEQLLLMGLVH